MCLCVRERQAEPSRALPRQTWQPASPRLSRHDQMARTFPAKSPSHTHTHTPDVTCGKAERLNESRSASSDTRRLLRDSAAFNHLKSAKSKNPTCCSLQSDQSRGFVPTVSSDTSCYGNLYCSILSFQGKLQHS